MLHPFLGGPIADLNTGDIIYSVHIHDFESPWFWHELTVREEP